MLSSYIIEQAFRQLRLPEQSLRQFAIASSLSDVGGKGFPRELFTLSAPVVVRGLLNYAVFQMRSQWVYPMWVHRQLDPLDPSFTARSQNPLFINITHRNWTLLGSPHGRHEAIVDPRGLATPLPREWSIDMWIYTDKGPYYPSLAKSVRQEFDLAAPTLRTCHDAHGLDVQQEHFVGTTNNRIDILFQEVAVHNPTDVLRTVAIGIAVRPFNPEGVSPIQRITVEGRRFFVVNGVLGLVFSEEPAAIELSNGERGDAA